MTWPRVRSGLLVGGTIAALVLLAGCSSAGSTGAATGGSTSGSTSSAGGAAGGSTSSAAGSTPAGTTPSFALPPGGPTPGSSSPPPGTGSAPATPKQVKAAAAAALGMYRETPNDVHDISKGTFWTSTPWAEAPVTAALLQRVSDLKGLGYFGDAECGLDYLTGSQWGMATAPTVRSAAARPDGSVAVVVRRDPVSDYPDITVVMVQDGGRWRASDLVLGTGPHASIFSARPLC